jgi:hypothetical protein
MKFIHKFTNGSQSTTTVNGLRYDANRAVREFGNRSENGGGNVFITTSIEMMESDDCVVFSCIDGDFTRLIK